VAWIYILRGASGRHYIGSTVDLEARLAQHARGHTATTKRLGGKIEVVAKKEVPTLGEAREIERFLKRKKSRRMAIYYLRAVEQPRKLSGLVGSSILPPGIFYSVSNVGR
jgi:putative endonuclease